MKTWLLYALLATFSWGTYIVVAKIATSSKYCGLEPKWSAILMWVGIGIVFVLYWLLSGGGKLNLKLTSLAAGVSSGVVKGLADAGALRAIEVPTDPPFPAPDSLLPGAKLTAEQAEAATELRAAVTEGTFHTFLIDGVTGFLVPYGDAEAFAERTVELLSDSGLWRKMSEGAIERTRDLTWERCARETEHLLEALVGRKEKGGGRG